MLRSCPLKSQESGDTAIGDMFLLFSAISLEYNVNFLVRVSIGNINKLSKTHFLVLMLLRVILVQCAYHLPLPC